MFTQIPAHKSQIPFFIGWQLKPESNHYNLCFSYQIPEKFAKYIVDATICLVKEKAYLRQTFNYENEQLSIRIHDELPPDITILRCQEKDLSELEKRLSHESHDIFFKSSLKLSLVHIDNSEECLVFFNIHHIIMDGISLDNFILDLNSLLQKKLITKIKSDKYSSQIMKENKFEPLKPPASLEHYLTEIKEIHSQMNTSISNENMDVFHFQDRLPSETLSALNRLKNEHGISLFNLLLLAIHVFLLKIFNQDAGIIQYPVNIRKQKEVDGCFVNVISIALKLNNEESYLSLIHAFSEQKSFLKYLATLFNDKLHSIHTLPSFAVSNLAKPLDLVLNNQLYDAKTYAQLASAPISIKYQEREGHLYFTCDVASHLMPDCLAKTLLPRFFNFIHQIIKSPLSPLTTFNLLFLDEFQFLEEMNRTKHRFPSNKTIHQLFEDNVEKLPDHTALIYKKNRITYKALNQEANQLAHYLREQFKINSGDLVAICLSRSPELIVAMLAIMKAGGAYISLNANFHSERTRYILNDTKAKLIITLSELSDKAKSTFAANDTLPILSIDEEKFIKKLANKSKHNLESASISTDLAHLIYTSGTTGTPKGVMIEHRNVVSLVKEVNYIHITEKDTFALFSDITFDASTFEIWGALLNGAKLFIPYERLNLLSDSHALKNIFQKYQISILWLTKTLFDHLFFLDETLFSPLSYLLVGGEALNKSLIDKLSASSYKPKHLINGYGPTENTTFSCTYDINHKEIEQLMTVPIGAPFTNRVAYVLDLHLNLMPMGAVGELYVGGAGLSQGYLNKNELTTQKFIVNPFQTKEEKRANQNMRLYKTGDLARILSNGLIECLGRNDFQVKIRGYRIEVTEIENALVNHPDIHQAAVIENRLINPEENVSAYLIGYFVADNPIDELTLRNFLLHSLPEYMLPTLFVYMEDFPTTASGKLDIKALPKPSKEKNKQVGARNEQEHLVLAAFVKILGLENISIHDDFFLIGGNSIKAIALAALLQSHFKITVNDIFNKKTPEKIAENIIYSKNDLSHQLNKVKLHFQQKKDEAKLYKEAKEKIEAYEESIFKEKIAFSSKAIQTILLTGATGYLGINLLYQILETTNYRVLSLVRANSVDEAYARVNKKYQFYFEKSLDEHYPSRLNVYPSDLEKEDLGLNSTDYQFLMNQTDSIIHCAALTKHYGEYDKFYAANVKATIHLLKLGMLTKSKDFHHISTLSVLDNSCDNQEFLSEDDVISKLDNQSNIYIKTKHEAEKEVLEFRDKGLNVNIYRVGNLAFIAMNSKTQENIEDNAFFSRMKCLVQLNAIAKEISTEEISPVDFTAHAILKLMDKKELTNKVFHLFNPNLCDVTEFFSLHTLSTKILSINEFVDLLASSLTTSTKHHELIMRYMLHQGWLAGEHRAQVVHHVLQKRTNSYLEHLGFQWPIISKETFWSFIEKSYLHYL